jgi:hypothetical protein
LHNSFPLELEVDNQYVKRIVPGKSDPSKIPSKIKSSSDSPKSPSSDPSKVPLGSSKVISLPSIDLSKAPSIDPFKAPPVYKSSMSFNPPK